jgi:aryl-alcohol dehydrogenase-like predicted oxidoreductase
VTDVCRQGNTASAKSAPVDGRVMDGSGRREVSKDAELLVSRHENAIPPLEDQFPRGLIAMATATGHVAPEDCNQDVSLRAPCSSLVRDGPAQDNSSSLRSAHRQIRTCVAAGRQAPRRCTRGRRVLRLRRTSVGPAVGLASTLERASLAYSALQSTTNRTRHRLSWASPTALAPSRWRHIHLPDQLANVGGQRLRYQRLGLSGLMVSRIALGMMSFGDTSRRDWHLDADGAAPIVRRAVEAGVTFFDTADMYDGGASEAVTGQLLSNMFSRRDDYVLASKVYYPTGVGLNDRGLSRKHILSAIDATLRRLNTDYLDLYQIHRWDGATPIEETMQTLHGLVLAGKVRYLGASSMFAWQFAKAPHAASIAGLTRFISMQNHYNLVYREEEREMIPQCIDQGVGVIPYSPLARGLLTGTRERGRQPITLCAAGDPLADDAYTDDDFDVVDALRGVAVDRGLPPAQIALAWLLHKPGITAPIIGATKLRHLDDALAAIDVDLEADELTTLEGPYLPHHTLGHT